MAFSLVELLVVIVIIAILAALLFPVLATTKAASKGAVCLSNVKQIYLGTALYAGDFDDRYPQLRDSDPNPSQGDANGGEDEPSYGSVFPLLYPYTKDQALLTCPMDTDPFGKRCQEENPDTPELSSYLMNAAFVFGLSEEQVSKPAESIEFAERRTGFCDDLYHPWFNVLNAQAPEDQMDRLDGAIATDRHGVVSTYGFADGHAKALPFSVTYSPPEVNMHLP